MDDGSYRDLPLSQFIAPERVLIEMAEAVTEPAARKRARGGRNHETPNGLKNSQVPA